MVPPHGEARPNEAANLDVRFAVAQAAVAGGNIDFLRTVVDLVPEGFHRAIIQAEVMVHTDAEPSALASAYGAVWLEVTNEEERVLYWLAAASAGVALHGTDELAARTDDVPILVDAEQHIARGEHEIATTLLRASRRTEHTTRLLVRALVGAGDIDGAVAELKNAATRFNDTMHLVRAVELLASNSRLSDAAILAEEALQRVPASLTEARGFLHSVTVERAGVAKEWGEMAVRARASIEDIGPSPGNRWDLAFALFHGGDRFGAWRVLQDGPALQPKTTGQAQLWILLASYEAPSADVADQIIALVDSFPDDKRLAEVAASVFFGRGDLVWGTVRLDTITRFQEIIAAQAAEFGSDGEAKIRVLSGSAEQMMEKLRPSLEANAHAVAEMTEKVRQGMPYGLLAGVCGRPYATALIHRAAGCLPIATLNPELCENEREAARAALGNLVAVDISTLVVGSFLRTLWPQLRASFPRLEIPSPAYLDVLNAVEDFRAPSHGTLYYDIATRSVRGTEANNDTTARLLDQGEWVASEAADVLVTDWPHLVALSEGLDDTVLPWLSALDMAKTRRMPLWCDDLGLRALAASDGVAAFGTAALVATLTDEGRLDPGAARSALRQLRQEYAVDLPLDAEWLRLSAASEEWRGGPAAFYFTRPPVWVEFEQTYKLWSELAQLASAIH